MKKLLFSILTAALSLAVQAQESLTPTTITPADGSEMEQFTSLELKFDEDVTVTGNATMHKGSTDGTEVSANWHHTASGHTAMFFQLDEYDEFTEPIALEPGVDYYITVPAGSIKGKTSGLQNADITVKVTGKAKALKCYSTTPYNNSELEQFTSLEATFSENVIVSGNAKLTKGAQDGPEVSVIWGSNVSGAKATFFSWDEYYEFTEPISLEPGVDYYLTIPAGIVTGKVTGAKNEQIVVKFTGKIKELKPVSISPADGSILEKFSSITLNFAEKVSVVSGKTPTLTKGSQSGSDMADQWNQSVGASSVTYWIEDLDGFTDEKVLEGNVDYYVTIPAGAIKNNTGTLTEQIVVKITGKQAKLTVVSTTPDDGTETTSFSSLTVNFGEQVSLVSGKQAKIVEGSKQGPEVTAYWGSRTEGTGIVAYTLDEYYEGPETVALTPGKTYYVIIPAGMVKNAAGAVNDEVAVKLVSPALPIQMVSSTPADGAEVAEPFTTITVTFAEAATVVKKDTEAKLTDAEGKDYGWVDFWYAFAGTTATDINFTALDMDLFTMTVSLQKDASYTFTIPAGVVANAAGGKNAEITITLLGQQTTTGIEAISNGKTIKATKQMRDGRIIIQLGADAYTASGALVK